MRFARYVFSVTAISVWLAACGGSQAPIGAPGMVSESPQVGTPFTVGRGYRVLFRFKGKDGAGPQGLTAFDGLLYGTTSGGGRNDAGTFFSLTTSGEKRTLHDFSGKNGSPGSILTPLNGLLYGWTDDHCNNTSSDCGEIFSLDTSGHERTLHVFHEQDQLGSVTSLTAMNGVLYGTTANGLSSDDGTVFSLTPNGDFQVLYHFQGQFTPSNDGAWPDSIVALNGTLYGTTIYGGKNGNGTVFNVTTTGKEHVVYSFGKALSGDGADPNAVMLLHGKLYGTTWSGGDSYECWGDPPIGCGTVFSVTTLGEERVLYSFQGQSAGYFANPTTGLAALKGKLYGTTGSGILFSITTGGTEKTLLSLKHCEPCSVLTPLKGTLYGTMPNGGKHHSGIAFAFTP